MTKPASKKNIRQSVILGISAGIALVVMGGAAMVEAGTGFGLAMLPPVIGTQNTGLRLGFFRTHWCGNGKIEYRETCDDGNRRNGDGCSRTCQNERKNVCTDGHRVGESFPSPDGCNICTCTGGGIACTKRACITSSSSSSRSGTAGSAGSKSSVAITVKCLSSEQCGANQYCTTEDGDCQSACEPGAMCIQACAGVCRSNQCRPYVCADGTRHPSCTEDGHVINYFADPCLTHGVSSSARY